MKKLILLFVLTLLPLLASAYDYDAYIDGIYYNLYPETNEAEVTTTFGNSYTGIVIIPDCVTYSDQSYYVTSIGDFAFSNCVRLTSITIPQSVTTIGSASFQFCSGLTSITIPNNVKTIGDFAFSHCRGVTSVAIPNNVKSIGKCVFQNCDGLASITIPNRVTSIGDNAFSGCVRLTSITIPNNVKTIGSWAFASCGLISLSIPNSVTSIGDYAFNYCSRLTSLSIPNSVTSIGERAFAFCSGLKNVYCYAENVPNTHNSAFSDSPIAFATLYVSASSAASYKSTVPWNGFGNITSMIRKTITYLVDGEVYKTYEVYCNAPITPEPAPTKEGYTFSGWSDIPKTMPANDVVVTGTFSLNSYTLTYMLDGKVYKTSRVAYGTTLTPEVVASKEGYTFSGWSEIPETMPAHDVTVTGSFSVNSYTLTYMVDGNEYKSLTVVYGTALTPEKKPTKEGYTFSGWNYVPSTMPAHDVVVTGSFTINSYTLTYKIDGKVYKTYKIDYDTVLIPESVPVKKGMTFSGWGDVPENMPAHDVVLTGSYSWSQKTLNSAIYQVIDTLNNYAAVIGNEKVSGDVKILPSVEMGGYDYAVTLIGNSAFNKCSELASITIPESVTSIESNAFSGCSNLHTVTLKSNPIVSKAYTANSSLKNIFGEQVEEYIIGDKVASISSYAFYGCTGMSKVTIPSSVTSIGKDAFTGCSGLTSVHISDLAAWCRIAFGDSSKSGSVSNPLSIAHHLFLNGEEVKDLVIPSSVSNIGYLAFWACHGLTSVTIPGNVTSIGRSAFPSCHSLASVTICDGVTNIDSWAFYNCQALTSVTIGNSVTSIGEGAFNKCPNLTSINIPQSVTSIGNNAFADCSGLSSVTVCTDNLSLSGVFSDSKNVEKLIYGEGCTKTVSTGLTSVSEVVLPKTLQTIDAKTFCNFRNLKEITIPQSVASIGENAFYGCSNLASVKVLVTDYSDFCTNKIVSLIKSRIGKPIMLIDENGNEIKDFRIPQGVTNIGEYAFDSCRGLTSITIPQSVISIGDKAFRDCSNLASVKVLVTDYSDFCTNKIVGLIKSRIGKPVMLIDENGNEIKDFRIPEGVTTVGEYAFCNCSGLTSVLIPSSVTSISQQAFSGCNNVEKLIYGEGCTKAVSTGLTSVSEVVLPKTLQTIDANAFYNFRNLKTITIPQSVTSIGQQAFYGCAALASATIENNNLTEIYQSSFPSQAKLYVKRGTKTLLTLWKNGYTRPYEIGTDKQLLPSSLSVVSTTQMTATVKVNDFYDGYAYTFNDEKIGKDTKTLSVPYPGYKFNQPLKISLDDVLYITNPYSFQTKGLNMKAERTGGTASSMTVKASYEHGDAPVTAQTLSLGGVTVEDDEIYLNGLKPSASYTVTYIVWINNEYAIRENFNFRTNALQFTASQPKVISAGNVIIAAQSNLDDGETNVGFEWRRTDWTNEFQSNKAGAYLYEGMMEGYIRNLNTDYLWKYRPYYEAQDGSRYYGDWTGIDPTNTSYFEPTVHTYNKIEVNGNRAKVKGYAMRGSENIVSQGFRYWRSTESATRAQQVEADGQVMSIELKGLDYHTTYRVVAFVTTSEGKTYYGKEQLFTTGDPTGIEETFADEPQKITEEGIYDLSGRKLERMQKGINIIRKADGTTKKVLVK